MSTVDDVLFEESQRFNQIWVWLILLTISGFTFFALIWQVFLGNMVGTNPAPNVLIVLLWTIFGVGFPTLFASFVLRTKVYPGIIAVRFHPIHRKDIEIPISELRKVSKLKFNPIREYGGWGIRYGFQGKAYIVSGNRGVKLYFKSEKPLLIGSKRSIEFHQAIKQQLSGDASNDDSSD